MKNCPNCGGEMIAGFTDFYCADECDLKKDNPLDFNIIWDEFRFIPEPKDPHGFYTSTGNQINQVSNVATTPPANHIPLNVWTAKGWSVSQFIYDQFTKEASAVFTGPLGNCKIKVDALATWEDSLNDTVKQIIDAITLVG